VRTAQGRGILLACEYAAGERPFRTSEGGYERPDERKNPLQYFYIVGPRKEKGGGMIITVSGTA